MPESPTAVVGRPATTTPPRLAPSIRRTTTVDSTRPEGLDGPVRLVAEGRDVVTATDRSVNVREASRIEIMVTPTLKGVIVHMSGDPPDPGYSVLVGSSPYSGFRRAVHSAIPAVRTSMSVRRQLLDDVPIALMLSGRVLRAAGRGLGEALPGRPPSVDICAGWVDGGTAVLGYSETGPPLRVGPVAPDVEEDGDPLAWHAHDHLPPHSTRRRRRLDVWDEDGLGRTDCFFRDSHVDRSGVETVVHEYTVRAAFDPDAGSFVEVQVDFGALPYPECPSAMTSVPRLEGTSAEGLGRFVRTEMRGTSTCTHLNDQLCSLEVVPALYAALPR